MRRSLLSPASSTVRLTLSPSRGLEIFHPLESCQGVSKDCSYDLEINGVRVRQKFYGAVTGLPNPVDGLTFIVSGMVRDAISVLPAHMRRPDVCAPDTGPDAIRNDKGQIVAVRGLVQ